MSADSFASELLPGESADRWHRFYSRKPTVGPYPTEWVVRTIAGANYPGLKLDKSKYAGATILDLSCGDGRNLPLLLSLSFEVHATEISEPLVNDLRQLATARSWPVSFRVGQNTSLPYPSQFFDYLLSCGSLYYLDIDTSWSDVIREIARIMQPGGILIANFPDPDNAVLSGGESLPDGSMVIRNDPFKLRNGLRFMVARSNEEVGRLIRSSFDLL